MSHRTQRPLSEIEIQILDLESISPSKTKVSTSSDEINKLQPPSLEELEAIHLPSLEELHREHAYTSLHSQIVRNAKERMKHFDRENRRKSYHGGTEREISNEYGEVVEYEKRRKPPRRSSTERRKRRSYGGHSERDTMTESEKSRRERKKNFEKYQRRLSYHAATEAKQECMKSFERLQRSKSCGARPIKVREWEPEVLSDREITLKENEKNLEKLKLECVCQKSASESQLIELELHDCLESLLDKFSMGLSLENKENNIGRKDTLTSADQGGYTRKDTLTSSDQDLFLPRSRNNTIENG